MEKVKCPHCGYIYNDDDMISSKNYLWDICTNQEVVDEVCASCGKVFWIKADFIPEYIMYKTEDEMYP